MASRKSECFFALSVIMVMMAQANGSLLSLRIDVGRPGRKWKAPLGCGFLGSTYLQDIVKERVDA